MSLSKKIANNYLMKRASNNTVVVEMYSSVGNAKRSRSYPINSLQKGLMKDLSDMSGLPYNPRNFERVIQRTDTGIFVQYNIGRGSINMDISIDFLSPEGVFKLFKRFTEIRGHLV
jgi:hypothetical protein